MTVVSKAYGFSQKRTLTHLNGSRFHNPTGTVLRCSEKFDSYLHPLAFLRALIITCSPLKPYVRGTNCGSTSDDRLYCVE